MEIRNRKLVLVNIYVRYQWYILNSKKIVSNVLFCGHEHSVSHFFVVYFWGILFFGVRNLTTHEYLYHNTLNNLYAVAVMCTISAREAYLQYPWENFIYLSLKLDNKPIKNGLSQLDGHLTKRMRETL